MSMDKGWRWIRHSYANTCIEKELSALTTPKTKKMKPKMIWANLAIADVERTAAFYSKPGFKPNGPRHITDDLTSFLFGDNGFVIHFFRQEKLRAAMNAGVAAPKTGSEVIVSLSAGTRDEVDDWATMPEAAVVGIFRQPGEDEA